MSSTMKLIIIIYASLGMHFVYCQEDPIVDTSDGQVRGTVNTTVTGQQYFCFRGIPYAEPPIGQLRFANPVKKAAWSPNIWEASRTDDICAQSSSGLEGFLGSEDCLYLDVYTPDLNGNYPVMFWIHGGGFSLNSKNSFDPQYILDKEIVFVSINYRLGVFGFLSSGDSVAPGNWGLKDQVLALKWVQSNIKKFGGDPEKVTIFGQSAGAASVAYLLQAPSAEGLYRGAIMNSGNSLCSWSLTRNPSRMLTQLAIKLGILPLSSSYIISTLRNRIYTSETLKNAENTLFLKEFITRDVLAGFPFAIVIEPPSESAILTGKSHQMISNGNFHRVPLLVGYTSNETASLYIVPQSLIVLATKYDLDVQSIPPYDLTNFPLNKGLAGIKIRQHYAKRPSFVLNPSSIGKFTANDLFIRPIREGVHQYSKYVNVFYYLFGYEGILGNPGKEYTGVSHAEDMFYISYTDRSATVEDDAVREKMVTMWCNFVKDLNPTPTSDPILNNVQWTVNSPTTSKNDVSYLYINSTLDIRQNPEQVDWEFYQKIYADYGVPPYTTY